MHRILVDDDPRVSQAVEIAMVGGTVPILQTFVGCGHRTAEMEFESREDLHAL
jgi:hypothetical protein